MSSFYPMANGHSRLGSWLLYFDLLDELPGAVAVAGDNLLRAEYLVPWTHAMVGGCMDAARVLQAAKSWQPYALVAGELPYFLEDAFFTVECGTSSSTVSVQARVPSSWRASPSASRGRCPFPAYDFRGLNRPDLLVGSGLRLLFPYAAFRHQCSLSQSTKMWTFDSSDPDTLEEVTSRVVRTLRTYWGCEYVTDLSSLPGIDEYARLAKLVEFGRLMPSILRSSPNLRRIHQRMELMNPPESE